MRDHAINFSIMSAEALDSLCVVDHVGTTNLDLPAMAWLWFVLHHVPDDERWFPRGKWATMQHMEAQLTRASYDAAMVATGGDETKP